jgi:hypothetical protein
MNITIISRTFITWIALVVCILSVMVANSNDTSKSFYKFGPHDDFIILGIKINTGLKYFYIVLYSFVNSLFRAIFHNVITPWMINNIQDESRDKTSINRAIAYEVTSVHVIYNWVDWLLYMNILLAQIDMMIIEVSADLLMSCITTYYYLRPKVSTPIFSERLPLFSKLSFNQSINQKQDNNVTYNDIYAVVGTCHQDKETVCKSDDPLP